MPVWSVVKKTTGLSVKLIRKEEAVGLPAAIGEIYFPGG